MVDVLCAADAAALWPVIDEPWMIFVPWPIPHCSGQDKYGSDDPPGDDHDNQYWRLSGPDFDGIAGSSSDITVGCAGFQV
jgi:hypothetical protein